MKISNFFISVFSCMLLFNSSASHAQNETNIYNILNKGDTVIIDLNVSRGDIQWQRSLDGMIWIDIDNEVNDTLMHIADSSSYFRAKIIEGSCEPIFSDTAFIYAIQNSLNSYIGPSGGILEISDTASNIFGARIVIPENALNDSINISLSEADGTTYFIDDTLATAINIEPESFLFNTPVSITIPYDPRIEPDSVVVWYYDESDSSMIQMQIIDIDPANHTVTFATDHFSLYYSTAKGFSFSSDLYKWDDKVAASVSIRDPNKLTLSTKSLEWIVSDYYGRDGTVYLLSDYIITLMEKKAGLGLFDKEIASKEIRIRAVHKNSGVYTFNIWEGFDPYSNYLGLNKIAFGTLDSEELGVNLIYGAPVLFVFDNVATINSEAELYVKIKWRFRAVSEGGVEWDYQSTWIETTSERKNSITDALINTISIDDNKNKINDTYDHYIPASWPVASFITSEVNIVQGENIQFTDQSTNNPNTWLWDFGDGSLSTSQNPVHTYSTEGTYDVNLKASNNYGHDTYTSINLVTVTAAGSAPLAAFISDNYSITEGGTIQFTDESTNEPASWSWDFGDGSTSSQQNPSHTYNTAGTYTVELTVTNSIGSDTEIKSNYITVSEEVVPPVAEFSADKNSLIEGESIQFTDESTNEPTSWSWDFGDGSTSSVQNPTHTYSASGTYTVVLTATNSVGSDTETKTDFITVSEEVNPPVAVFTANKTSITLGQSIQFTDESTNEPTSWSWDFGDGGTSTEQHPSHAYNSVGKYRVTLTVTNSTSSDTEAKADYITVFEAGSDILFNPDLTYGSLTDIDGNTYKTIMIGNQEWMAENLKTTRYADETAITFVEDITEWAGLSNTDQAYCWLSNDINNKNTYGALYTWAAAMNGVASSEANPSGIQGVCPTGWHLPSLDEWKELLIYLGMSESDVRFSGVIGTNEGGKLKEIGLNHWQDPNSGASNESGFTALPSGVRDVDGSFKWIGTGAEFCTTTESDESAIWNFTLSNNSSAVGMWYADYKELGYSVRCVKGEGTAVVTAAFSADKTSITLGESIQFTDESTNEPTSWSWDFGDGNTSTDQNPSHTYSVAGNYTVSLEVTNQYGTDTETKANYITVTESGGGETGTFTDARDGKTYKTVKIGTQTWMAENIAYLPSVVGSGTGSYNTPYHYVYGYNGTSVSEAKTTSNYQTYGVLYNWPAAVNACPTGWHLPTDAEWKTLEMHLGMSQAEADGTGWRGTDEGGKLKETGTTHWRSPNTGATNESGFTALPGGFRYLGGSIYYIGGLGDWWSATENDTSNAWSRGVGYDYSTVRRSNYFKGDGFSVRCLRDQTL